MKPQLIKLTGSALTKERYTYGERLAYGGGYAYGGVGSLISVNTPQISLSLIRSKASDMGTLITYDDINTLYNDTTKRYNGADTRQDDGPQLSIMV
jgi:hypothetical protein